MSVHPIRPAGQPRDYAEPFVFVPSHNAPPTFGERLVTFFRMNGEIVTGIIIGVPIGGLLTSALAYVIAWVRL